MKNIGIISVLAMILILISSCSSDDKTNTESLSNSGKILEMESSNEGGGNDNTDLLNDSFR